ERIALHLQLSDPGGERWVVDGLLGAGVQAFRSGAFESAQALLARALDEPPEPDQLGPVLFELGRSQTEDPELLETALQTIGKSIPHLFDERERARAATEIGSVLGIVGELGYARLALGAVLEGLTDDVARARVASMLLVNELRAAGAPAPDGDTPGYAEVRRLSAAAPDASYGGRLLAGALALEALCSGAPASPAGAHAHDALHPLCPAMLSDEMPMRGSACLAAALSDQFVLARTAIDHELEAAVHHGSPYGLAHAQL